MIQSKETGTKKKIVLQLAEQSIEIVFIVVVRSDRLVDFFCCDFKELQLLFFGDRGYRSFLCRN